MIFYQARISYLNRKSTQIIPVIEIHEYTQVTFIIILRPINQDKYRFHFLKAKSVDINWKLSVQKILIRLWFIKSMFS